jgi:helicase
MRTEPRPDPFETLRSLGQSADLQREIAQLRARTSLEDLLGRTPTFRWTYSTPRAVRNATALLLAVRRVAQAPARIAEIEREALLAARTWESLADLGEGINAATARLNAALSYELAGYQANAASIARLIAPRRSWAHDRTFDGMVAAFVQRLLVRVLHQRWAFMRERDDLVGDELLRAASMALAGQGMQHASTFFLSGNGDEIDLALTKLQLAEDGFAEVGDVVLASTAASLRAMVPTSSARSTWALLGAHSDAPRWRRYLKVLARGTGARVIDARSVSELWPSQRAAVEAGLLTNRSSYVVKMPTSAGKTRVAEMAIVDQLVHAGGTRCLYVAPYRALASEVNEAFANLFTDLGFSSASVLGAYEENEIDELAAQSDDILVLTPEKLDLLIRLRPEVLTDVRLIVLDETQIVGDQGRGLKYELLVSRLKRLAPDARFLLLSAVVPHQTLLDFSQWVGADPGAILESGWRPSTQRVAALEWSRGRGVLRFASLADNVGLERFVPNIVREEEYEELLPSGRAVTRRFPEDGKKGQIAAALAYQLAPRGPVLIFVPQTNWAEAVGRALLRRVSLGLAEGGRRPGGISPCRRSGRSATRTCNSNRLARPWSRANRAAGPGDSGPPRATSSPST